MDESVEKNTIHKKIMTIRDDYVENDMCDRWTRENFC